MVLYASKEDLSRYDRMMENSNRNTDESIAAQINSGEKNMRDFYQDVTIDEIMNEDC